MSGAHAADAAVEAQQIQSGQSHKGVDDPGEPGQVAEQKIYQVKFKEPDEAPVDGPDNNQCQRSVIKKFGIHSFSSYLQFFFLVVSVNFIVATSGFFMQNNG